MKLGLGGERITYVSMSDANAWACWAALHRPHHQICRISTLNQASDRKFYKFLRPSIDHNLPNSEKSGTKYTPHLQTNAGGVGITGQITRDFDP